MNIDSPKVTVDKSAEYLFEQLTNLNNFVKLMPENISKFEVVSEDAFDFCLTGMPEIKLKLKDKFPCSKIVLGAASDKLPFTLSINIETVTENSSAVQLNFEGIFNAMMGMMVKGPITKFIETLAQNTTKL